MRDKKSANDRARDTWSYDDRDVLLTLPRVLWLEMEMPVAYLRDFLAELKQAVTPEDVQSADLTAKLSTAASHGIPIRVYMDRDQILDLLKIEDRTEEMFARLSPAAAVEDGAEITVRRKGAVPPHVAELSRAVDDYANTFRFNSTTEQGEAAKLALNRAVESYCQVECLTPSPS